MQTICSFSINSWFNRISRKPIKLPLSVEIYWRVKMWGTVGYHWFQALIDCALTSYPFPWAPVLGHSLLLKALRLSMQPSMHSLPIHISSLWLAGYHLKIFPVLLSTPHSSFSNAFSLGGPHWLGPTPVVSWLYSLLNKKLSTHAWLRCLSSTQDSDFTFHCDPQCTAGPMPRKLSSFTSVYVWLLLTTEVSAQRHLLQEVFSDHPHKSSFFRIISSHPHLSSWRLSYLT